MPPVVPPIPNQPLVTVVVPVYVFAPVKIQVPPSCLLTERAPPLSASTPEIVLASLFWPRRFSVLAPAPDVTITPVAKVSGPLPLESMVALPVVPAILMVRVTASPGP